MNFKVVFYITALIAVSVAEYKSYKDYKVYKIDIRSEDDVKIVNVLKDSEKWYFWSDIVKIGGDVRIMVSPEEEIDLLNYLSSVEIQSEVVIKDVQQAINEQMKRPQSMSRNANEYAWNYYQSLEEIDAWLDHIVAKHSDVASIVSLGNSVENRNIRGVRIDFKKRRNPTIGVVESGIHAREWIAPATATWIIKEFLESTDPDVRVMAENIVWHIFPVFNPDGYKYTFTNDRMWRKNRQTAHFTSCAHRNQPDDMSNGVDLNRNFAFQWMVIGASQDPCDEVYAGPVPFSEPESIAMVNYILALQEEGNLVYYISFHSYSQMLLVPYSHVGGADVLTVPYYADLYEIAIKGAEKLKEVHGTDYVVGTSEDVLYAVGGDSVDWVKAGAEVPLSFLFELRDIGPNGFLLTTDQIIPNNEEVMAGLVEMDKTARKIGFYHASSAASVGLSAILLTLVVALIM